MALEILDQSLDMSFGELPRNLSSLYRYLIRRLTEVHATLDVNTLEECKGIIGKIADGFAQAYEQLKKQPRRIPQGKAPTSIRAEV
jgi:flagellin-specific chaperone FliS